jgi:6-phosphogluconolactonase/glucosamine-6-phosphate isomerase/deaminase
MKEFDFNPSQWIPMRDKNVLDKVRAIKRESIDKHHNPDLNIQVVPDSMVEHIFVTDIFYRIVSAREEGRNVVLLLPNPNHGYIKLAHLINKFRLQCDHLFTFNLDEYADQDGNIAPESYPQGFLHATKNYLFKPIDESLRPPENQIVGFTNDNLNDYGKMITDMGGADAVYTGPGWTGHIAFIEPDAPEFETDDLEEWKKMGPRIVTLSPFTIAQNSLHGSFGMSGDLAAVPPKAATIGPAQVIEAKYRMDTHALNTAGTRVSWQRFITRLVLHGPITPKVPTSIIQALKADVIVSETAAMNIEPVWDQGY